MKVCAFLGPSSWTIVTIEIQLKDSLDNQHGECNICCVHYTNYDYSATYSLELHGVVSFLLLM